MRFAKNLGGVQKKSWKYRIRILQRIVVVTDKELGAISKQMCLWLRLHQEGTFRTREDRGARKEEVPRRGTERVVM